MVSDMFNNSLKGRIDGLCNEVSALVANEGDLITSGSFQSQSQGGQRQGTFGGRHQQQSGSGPVGRVSVFVPPLAGSSGHWWPADLGQPTSTGAQNNVRYAYFGQTRRLAIEVNGRITIYDTLDHQISSSPREGRSRFQPARSGGCSQPARSVDRRRATAWIRPDAVPGATDRRCGADRSGGRRCAQEFDAAMVLCWQLGIWLARLKQHTRLHRYFAR